MKKGGKKTATKAAAKKMHAAIIIDRSGSMRCMWGEAKSHFREQIAAMKKESEGMDITVSLTFFDDEIEILGPRLSLKQAEELDLDKYSPRGCTALYDAIGTTVGRLKKFKNTEDTAFLVVTITDGLENASSDYTQEKIQKEVKELTKSKRWTFTFMAANIDGQHVAQGMGMSSANVMQFSGTSKGMSHANFVAASATGGLTRSVKLGGNISLDNMYEGNEDVTIEDSKAQSVNNK